MIESGLELILEDLTKVVAKIIGDCEIAIINQLTETIGEKNIISVIMTGGVARNKPTCKSIDGKLYLESDLDVVVVVSPRSIIKSLILIKHIANRLTSELRKQRLLSGVSLSIVTEKSLCNSPPTIFYQDLVLNGKTIFGKDICKTLAVYDTNKIPTYDIYRLVFNRMIETLEVFVSSGFIERKLTIDSFYSVLNSIEKLTFALIQAMLVKKNILIFRGFDLNEFQKQNLQENNFIILKELLASHEELRKAKESRENLSEDILIYYWNSVIRQFNSTIEALADFDNIRQIQIKRLVLGHEKLSRRLKLCIILFLQYFGNGKTVDLFRTIVYRIRFGSDYVYIPMYCLFLSTEFLHDGEPHNMKIYKEVKSTLRKLCDATSVKLWTKSFNKHLVVWKFISG
jgi:predicted nucleotidyltransferase